MSEERVGLHARIMASDLRRRHQLGVPVDLRRLAAELGLEVVSFPFEGRIKEAIIGRTIGVQSGLPRPWFRWYVAHAIGHHMLHVGTSFYLQPWQWVSHAKAERQAEEFAAWLVGGADGWRRASWELGVPAAKLTLVRRLTSPRTTPSLQDLALGTAPAPQVSGEVLYRLPLLFAQVVHLAETRKLTLVDRTLELLACDVTSRHR